jgi:hypothetical protein
MSFHAVIRVISGEEPEILLHRTYDGTLAVTGADLYWRIQKALAAIEPGTALAAAATDGAGAEYDLLEPDAAGRVTGNLEAYYVVEFRQGAAPLVGYYRKAYHHFPECYYDNFATRKPLTYQMLRQRVVLLPLEEFRGLVNADIERVNRLIEARRAQGDFLGTAAKLELLAGAEGLDCGNRINMAYALGKNAVSAFEMPNGDFRFFAEDTTIEALRAAKVDLKAVARRLNDHHRRTLAGFYASKLGGRYFRARVSSSGNLEVTPDFGQNWTVVPNDQIAFHDGGSGREIPMPLPTATSGCPRPGSRAGWLVDVHGFKSPDAADNPYHATPMETRVLTPEEVAEIHCALMEVPHEEREEVAPNQTQKAGTWDDSPSP